MKNPLSLFLTRVFTIAPTYASDIKRYKTQPEVSKAYQAVCTPLS